MGSILLSTLHPITCQVTIWSTILLWRPYIFKSSLASICHVMTQQSKSCLKEFTFGAPEIIQWVRAAAALAEFTCGQQVVTCIQKQSKQSHTYNKSKNVSRKKRYINSIFLTFTPFLKLVKKKSRLSSILHSLFVKLIVALGNNHKSKEGKGQKWRLSSDYIFLLVPFMSPQLPVTD